MMSQPVMLEVTEASVVWLRLSGNGMSAAEMVFDGNCATDKDMYNQGTTPGCHFLAAAKWCCCDNRCHAFEIVPWEGMKMTMVAALVRQST